MKQFGMLLLGFCIGVASVVLFAGLVAAFIFMDWNDEPAHSDDHETGISSQQDEYFSLQSRAYLDEKPCPNIEMNEHVGIWFGENKEQAWVDDVRPDGKFIMHFLLKENGQLTGKSQTEHGYWSLSNCLFTIITTKINERPVLFEDVYRIHQYQKNKGLTYTHFSSGTTYDVKRVNLTEVPYPQLLEMFEKYTNKN